MVDVSDDPGVCCAPKYLYSQEQNSSQAEAPVCSPPVARGDQATNTLATPAHDKFPDLPKTKSSKGGYYTIESKGYQATVDSNVTYAKGWLTWIIELGDTVPAGTGGDLGITWGQKSSDRVSGSNWRFAKDDPGSPTGKKYWDGAAWQNVPEKWADPLGTQLLGAALWTEKGTPKVQYGTLPYPDKLPDWGDAENSLAARTIPVWKNNIESTWSGKFDLRRTQCPSSDDSCCRYHIAVVANFQELPAEDATIVLAPNAGRSNSAVWSLAESRANMPAHEAGHHLGNPDEYAGADHLDPTQNDDGAVKGIDPDSLMGQNMTTLKKRHFRFIGMQIAAMVDEASKKSNGFTYDALPAK